MPTFQSELQYAQWRGKEWREKWERGEVEIPQKVRRNIVGTPEFEERLRESPRGIETKIVTAPTGEAAAAIVRLNEAERVQSIEGPPTIMTEVGGFTLTPPAAAQRRAIEEARIIFAGRDQRVSARPEWWEKVAPEHREAREASEKAMQEWIASPNPFMSVPARTVKSTGETIGGMGLFIEQQAAAAVRLDIPQVAATVPLLAAGTAEYFFTIPKRVGKGEIPEIIGEFLVFEGIGGIGRGSLRPKIPVKYVKTPVGKGLIFEAGQKTVGLITKTPEGIRFLTPTLKRSTIESAYKINLKGYKGFDISGGIPYERAVIEKSLIKKMSDIDKKIYETTIAQRKSTLGVVSKHIEEPKIEEVLKRHKMKSITIRNVIRWMEQQEAAAKITGSLAKEAQISPKLLGSLAKEAQILPKLLGKPVKIAQISPKLLGKPVKISPNDIDLYIEEAIKKTEELMKVIEKTEPAGKFRIAKGGGIISQYGHMFDIKELGSLGYEKFDGKMTEYIRFGFPAEPPVKAGKFYLSSLSEEATKGLTSITIREKKGRLTLFPEEHRIKDIVRLFPSEMQLSLSKRFFKTAGVKRVKLLRELWEKKFEELSAKERAHFKRLMKEIGFENEEGTLIISPKLAEKLGVIEKPHQQIILFKFQETKEYPSTKISKEVYEYYPSKALIYKPVSSKLVSGKSLTYMKIPPIISSPKVAKQSKPIKSISTTSRSIPSHITYPKQPYKLTYSRPTLPPEFIYPKIPKLAKEVYPEVYRKTRVEEPSYVTFVRRFGKFRPIGVSKTVVEAFRKGKTIVKHGLGASFFVRGLRKEPKPLSKEFRKKIEKGRLVFIQKRKYRLAAPTEVKEIQAARIAGKKKLNKFVM